jgi:hypothetical protein
MENLIRIFSRHEKLIEGIQDFEKIRILNEKFVKEGDEEHLKELISVLSTFTTKNLETLPSADMVSKGKAILNGFKLSFYHLKILVKT